MITKEVPQASFFQYFGEPKEEEDEEEEGGEDGGGEEEKERIQLTEEEDFEIAHALRTAVIPDALLWFTGEAHVDEEYDDDYGDEGDEEEEDEEDEEEDDEPAAPKASKHKNKGGAPTGGFAAAPSSGEAGANGEQPECKQN